MTQTMQDLSQPPAPLLSIIVVSYNTREMTLACLRSVYAETRAEFELIVIDNASDDGSAAAIASEFPGVILMAETENHGFARANNIAAKRARGRYLLLLNPDTLVLDGALDALLGFAAARPDARIWGGRTLFGDRSLNPSSCWRRISLWNTFCRTAGLTGIFRKSDLFNGEAYGGWDRSTERQVDIVVGCLFLIRRADWEALGGFDTTFFMYGEEADLCQRARRQLGARPRVTPKATIVHYAGASEKVRADKMVRLLTAKVELIRRHVPGWQRPLTLALFRAWPLSRSLAFSLLNALGLKKDSGNAETWRKVWARRDEWKNGFSTNV
jgi:GT2 family glycosyltransferase